jgi:hypothetical protein
MRIWTLHPRYLDRRGLVALWREGLLAQAVLRGRTKGYRHHPQLARFRAHLPPLGCIASYLHAVQEEGARRGYEFKAQRIARARCSGRIRVTRGQLEYEWRHLKAKVARRDRQWLARLEGTSGPRAHPLFRVVPGDVEAWERAVAQPDRERRGTRGRSSGPARPRAASRPE